MVGLRVHLQQVCLWKRRVIDFGLVSLPSPLPAKHSREIISGGSAGTAQTIKRMRDLVTQGKRDFRVRTVVGQVIAGCPPKDYECYARSIYHFCRDEIKYAFDPNGVELLEAPYRILESRVADCDSIVMLFAAMCESIGLPVEFVTIKADRSRPSEYSHVYAQVKVPGRGWVAADLTMPDQQFGWVPGPEFPRKSWPSSHDMSEDREGDAMMGLGQLKNSLVPHAEETVGVAVGNEWNFRDEGALVVTSPEEIELSNIQSPDRSVSAQPHNEFFIRNDESAETALGPEINGQQAVPELQAIPVAVAPVVKRAPNWILLGGIALLAFWALRKR